MARNIIAAVLALVFVTIVLGFVLPDKVTLEREAIINAPQEDVYALISDFEEWDAWSPWAKIDPDAEMSISGEGIGQRMSWKSDDPNVGTGSQEITAMDPPNSLTTHMEFEGMGVADAAFTLAPTGDGATRVVWSFQSNMREGMPIYMQPMSTYMGFMMDGMLGPQYEDGLANLKKLAE